MSKLSRKKKTKISTEREILRGMGISIGKSIGEGTYSKVYVASAVTEPESSASSTEIDEFNRFACKIIHKRYAGAEFIKKFLPRELNILRHIKHRHIVTVYNIIEMEHSIFIIMDYCRGGDLLEFIRGRGPLGEDLARIFFRQITDAVNYLHSLHIAHRDLKCENILLMSEHSVKLADFGFARTCIADLEKENEPVLSSTFCGSAAYAAPEIIQGIPYDPKMYDMWALGCVLYIMISATMPFDDSNVKKMLKNQLNRSLCLATMRTWRRHCVHLRSLLGNLLEPDVSRRARISEVLSSPWLHKHSIKQRMASKNSSVAIHMPTTVQKADVI